MRTEYGSATAALLSSKIRIGRAALLAGSAAACLIAGSTAAVAQTQAPVDETPPSSQPQTPPPPSARPADQSALSDDAIVVTGSRIVRTKVTAQPVTVLGGDQISKMGYTNVGNALQELPAFGVPSNSPIGSQGSFSAGQTFVNLYNLGSQRTLTLVNGNRFVSGATSSIFGPVSGSPVDLSEIPAGLVDHIDTLSVGGAPIYGSDAIAGTVNVVLKKNFEGFELNAQNGISQHGDGADYTVSGLAGHNFAEGRGNITFSVMYDQQKGIPTSDREALGGSANFFGSSLDGDSFVDRLYSGGKRYSVFTNTGMPLFADGYPIVGGVADASVTNAAGQALIFNSSGKLVPFQNGTLTGNAIYQAGGDGFRIADYDNFLTTSKRIQGNLLGHYDITDHIRFSGEAWLGRDIGRNLRAQPYYSTALFNDAGAVNGDLIFNTNNPYLSAADRATIVSNLVANGMDPSTFYLARANTDLEAGTFESQSDLYRVVGTLSGDFNLGTHAFNWEVTGNYGHVKTTTIQRELVTQNFYNALDAVQDPSGNITCAPGYTNAAIATFSGTCAPLDVFGVNQASQAAINYITALGKTEQNNSQLDVVADVNGTIFTLPGGDVKVSLGYEHRREAVNFDPGTFYAGQLNADGTRTQFGNSIPITPVSGAYHTNEGFGELDVPVVSPDMHVPLIHSLNLQGAGRYVDNSLTGGFWTYTGGGTYSPIQDITFRGNYTRSFRAPAITEAFAPTGSVFDTASDPCDARYIAGGPDPSRRAANCAAAGITQPFTSNVVDFTAEGTSGGNPNLKNEVANSWTAGGVFEPRFLPGFKLSADYIAIDVSNEIATLSLTDLMDACYDSTNFSSNPYCSTFTRDGAGQVTSFTEGNYNIGIEHYRALQAVLDYNFQLSKLGLPEGSGSILLDVNYLHTFSHYTKIGEGDKQYSVGSSQEPTDNITANFNYNKGPFNFLWQTQYYGPTKINVNVPDSNYEFPKIHRYFMFNSSVGYDIGKHYSIRLVVNNVLNKSVPFPATIGSAGTGVDETRYYDALMGRYFKVNVGVKF